MIAAIALLAQSVVTLAPGLESPRPATSWSCDFQGADAEAFSLSGFFPEVAVGSDPNRSIPTQITGSGPARFRGAQRYNAHGSYADARTYMVHGTERDGASYTILLGLIKDENNGLATITRYVPDQAGGRGKLYAFATGHCAATFHPIGYKGVGK